METLSELLTVGDGNLPATGGFPHEKPAKRKAWCFLCYWPKQAVKQIFYSQYAGDLIRHDAMWRHWNEVIPK